MFVKGPICGLARLAAKFKLSTASAFEQFGLFSIQTTMTADIRFHQNGGSHKSWVGKQLSQFVLTQTLFVPLTVIVRGDEVHMSANARPVLLNVFKVFVVDSDTMTTQF